LSLASVAAAKSGADISPFWITPMPYQAHMTGTLAGHKKTGSSYLDDPAKLAPQPCWVYCIEHRQGGEIEARFLRWVLNRRVIRRLAA
jgi:hypothetical protein